MHKLTIITALTCLSLALVGCSGGDTMSQEDANQAFATTSLALANAQEVATEVSSDGGQIDASTTCSGGGSLAISGTFDGFEEFALNVEFSGCREGNVTISGSLAYDASISQDSITVSMVGSLSYSGDISGNCDISVTTTAGEAGASVSGSVCGQSVSASAGVN
ncbi:MAG: hypothetical protein Tsb0020_29210 [Haliangiales bacterium]